MTEMVFSVSLFYDRKNTAHWQCDITHPAGIHAIREVTESTKMTAIRLTPRRILLTGIAIALLVGVVVLGWRPFRFLMMPQWQRRVVLEVRPIADRDLPIVPDTPEGREFAPYWEIFLYLNNDLISRDRWTIEDAKYLDAIIRAGYDKEKILGDTRRLAFNGANEMSNHQCAVSTVTIRIGFDAPIDDDARKVLELTLLDELTAADEDRRFGAAHDIIYYHVVSDPKFRSAVLTAMSTLLDNDHRVLLEDKLRLYDEYFEAWRKYNKLKEGGGDATKP